MAQLKNRKGSGSEGSGAKYNNAVRLPSASTRSRRSAAFSGSSRSSDKSSGKKASTGSGSKKSSSKSGSKAVSAKKKKTTSKLASSNLRGHKSKAAKSNFREMVEDMIDYSAFADMSKDTGIEIPVKASKITGSGKASKSTTSAKVPKSTSSRSSSDDVLDQINSTFMQTVKDAEKAFASKRETYKLKVIPLGGMQEIGKNMTLFEYGNDIIIVDVGVAFPEESMLGVDSVIQDYTYVLQNKDRVRGIFLTHGHEDHIGSLPYLMRELKCPLYGGKLTIELARHKLMDAGVGTRGIEMVYCAAGDTIKAGTSFAVEFIRVNHSIADAFAFAIRTPIGNIIHTGDFKIDFTPINGEPIDLGRFAEYGRQGVLLMLAESTNVEIPGSSPSEKHVGESFQRIFQNTTGRIIIATFSSHVHRMQQIFTAAEMYNRKVALIG
ncbi:MAG: ribonuclease J, partial [Clostridiales bacterium]|nr:ribonuclease J [Clostridiales bacterium]